MQQSVLGDQVILPALCSPNKEPFIYVNLNPQIALHSIVNDRSNECLRSAPIGRTAVNK